MVHTGKPSRGCDVCRRRRIKASPPSRDAAKDAVDSRCQCDERVPECSYCIKTKQKCPGYKDPFDLAWRDQTSAAKKGVERRKRAAEKHGTLEQTSASQTTLQLGSIPDLMSLYQQRSASVPFELPQNPEESALTFFFTTYATRPARSQEWHGFLEFVSPLYLKAAPDSTLKMSTLAIASCLFTAWLNRRSDTPFSRSFYLRAVSAMKGQIINSANCSNDEMLLSILLLQFFEVCFRS